MLPRAQREKWVAKLATLRLDGEELSAIDQHRSRILSLYNTFLQGLQHT